MSGVLTGAERLTTTPHGKTLLNSERMQVVDVNPKGTEFYRLTRVVAENKTRTLQLEMDVAHEIWPVKLNDELQLTIELDPTPTTLRQLYPAHTYCVRGALLSFCAEPEPMLLFSLHGIPGKLTRPPKEEHSTSAVTTATAAATVTTTRTTAKTKAPALVSSSSEAFIGLSHAQWKEAAARFAPVMLRWRREEAISKSLPDVTQKS